MQELRRAALAAIVTVGALLGWAAPATAGPSVEIRQFGSAAALGAPDFALNGEPVDLAAHPSQDGYWLLGRDGGVFTYGAATFYGSTGGMRLNAAVLGMVPTPSGNGYWFVAHDGGVFSFGDAGFFGSTGGLRLNAPIVDMAATPTGNGYWLVAIDGGVFAFGDARFLGSATGSGVATTGIVAAGDGNGYTLLGADGSLRAFGSAPALAGVAIPGGAVDLALTPSEHGAWILGADGSIYTVGDAPFHGAATNDTLGAVALARTPGGTGYWIALAPQTSDDPSLPASSGTGRRVVYSNSEQRVWLVEASGRVAGSFPVSGRRGVPSPGAYGVFSKSSMSSAHGGSLRLPYMTRFARGRSLAIGFHGIPLRGDGTPIQSDDELGQYRSAGCVRMNQQDVKALWDFAPIGTPVVVLP